MRQQRLFEQLDEQERNVVETAAQQLRRR